VRMLNQHRSRSGSSISVRRTLGAYHCDVIPAETLILYPCPSAAAVVLVGLYQRGRSFPRLLRNQDRQSPPKHEETASRPREPGDRDLCKSQRKWTVMSGIQSWTVKIRDCERTREERDMHVLPGGRTEFPKMDNSDFAEGSREVPSRVFALRIVTYHLVPQGQLKLPRQHPQIGATPASPMASGFL